MVTEGKGVIDMIETFNLFKDVVKRQVFSKRVLRYIFSGRVSEERGDGFQYIFVFVYLRHELQRNKRKIPNTKVNMRKLVRKEFFVQSLVVFCSFIIYI